MNKIVEVIKVIRSRFFLVLLAFWATGSIAAEFVPLGSVALKHKYTAPAEVVSLNQAVISAEVAARVVAMPVLQGQVVDKGSVLIKFDCRDYQAQFDAAKARRKLAKQLLERNQQLVAKQHISQTVLDQQTTEEAIAEADLRRSALQVERCTVRSPYTAAVGKREVAVGAYVQPGVPLLSLTDLSSIHVEAQISAKASLAFQSGASKIQFQSRGRSYDLELENMAPVISTANRTRYAQFKIADPDIEVGRLGRLTWQPLAPVVSPTLVVRRDDMLGVFTKEGGTARFIPLPNAEEGRPAEVPIELDDLIAVSGHNALIDGQGIDAHVEERVEN